MSLVPLHVTLNKLETGEEAKENADILAIAIVVIEFFVSDWEGLCLLPATMKLWQAYLLAGK